MSGRTFAIGDIHGDLEQLQDLPRVPRTGVGVLREQTCEQLFERLYLIACAR